MASYLLFLPNAHAADPAQLDRVGLADLRTDRSPEFAECLGGQLGQGNFAYWHVGGISPVLDPSIYDWTPAPADKALELPAKRFWLGVPKGQIVTPDACQRDLLRPGYWLPMADGQHWHIPAAAKLPHKHGLDSEGLHTREVVAQFRNYWDKSQQFAAAMFQALDSVEFLAAQTGNPEVKEKVEFSVAETWDFACQAIGINYRLTSPMVSMLGLIDDDSMVNVVKMAIDMPTLVKVKEEKKKEVVTIPVTCAG